MPNYTISVSSDPSNGGMVTGGGTYQQGQSCTVTATVNSGYSFSNWTENGNQVSTNSSYTFTVNSNRTLVANFTYNGGGNPPTGAINGLFSVSADQQVYFSQGNLQYNASNNTWQFAASQYEIIGNDNSNISQTYGGWIDLFGWATSGWDCGNTYYLPWDSYKPYGNLYGPPGQYNLTGSYINSDWGYYNAISNGGNQPHQWRTLTSDEWVYVFNTRTTTSGIRYAMAKVNNVNGVILLPDNWNSSTYYLSYANQPGANFSSNPITSWEWSTLENAGAVFLPAAGSRYGTSVYDVGSYGLYWSSSYHSAYNAGSVNFYDSNFGTSGNGPRYRGQSVRLVQDNSGLPTVTVTTNTITNITQTTASGGGNVTATGGVNVTERGICWSTNHNPTTSGSHSSSGSGAGSFTVSMTSLTANTTYYVRAYAINNVGTAYGNEVSFTTLNNSGDHDYVDLGLPSGTLWATCNIGATSPKDYGEYFAWGETQPKDAYDWSNYQYCNGSSNTLTKYCNNTNYGYNGFIDNLTILLPEDDAATINWGGDWRVPTAGEWNELRDNTTCTWTTQNGINGQLFTASNGNSLFIPAAGSHTNAAIYVGIMGRYLSKGINTNNPSEITLFYFSSSGCSTYNGWERCLGYSIRPVCSPNNISIYTDTVTNITPTSALGKGIVVNDGGSEITERGICWSSWPTPTINNNHNNNGSGTGTYTVQMNGLTPGITYYARSYAINSTGIAYGNEVSFTTVGKPTVSTIQVSNITSNTAVGGGNVTSSGNGTVIERGVC